MWERARATAAHGVGLQHCPPWPPSCYTEVLSALPPPACQGQRGLRLYVLTLRQGLTAPITLCLWSEWENEGSFAVQSLWERNTTTDVKALKIVKQEPSFWMVQD